MLHKGSGTEFDVAELLVSAGFIQPHQLDKAYANARDNGVPMSSVLLDDGLVEARILQAAVDVNKAIREHRLDFSMGRTALYLMGSCAISLQDALDKLGVTANAKKNPWEAQLAGLSTSGKWRVADTEPDPV